MDLGGRQARFLAWAPAAVLALSLLGSGLLLAHEARSLWFFGDDFDFLLRRRWSLTGPDGLLLPHNEHWSTVPIVLFRTWFGIFGLRHYVPYALMPIGLHLATCLLVFLLLRRVGISSWSAVLAVLVAAFLGGGAGAENTLWDFQAGFLGSAAFGVLALWCLASEAKAGRAVAIGALIVALMSSGMGLLMVFWAGTYELLRGGLRSAIATVALPVLVYLSWYAAFGHGHTGAPPAVPAVAPLVAMKGLGQLWTAASAVPGAGPAVLVLLAAAVALPRTPQRVFALACSGLMTVVVAYLLFGFSRSGLGLDAATASRYVYFGVLFSVAAVATTIELAGTALRPRPWAGTVAWVLLAAVVVSVGTAQTVRFHDGRRGLTSDARARIAGAAQLVMHGDKMLSSQPSPLRNPDVKVEDLRRVIDDGQFPHLVPGAQATLDAAVNLQVGLEEQSFGFGAPERVQWSGLRGRRAQGVTGAGSACQAATAVSGSRLQIPTGPQPVQIRLATAGGSLSWLLESGEARSEVVRTATAPDHALYLGTTATDGTLVVRLPPGRVTVCLG